MTLDSGLLFGATLYHWCATRRRYNNEFNIIFQIIPLKCQSLQSQAAQEDIAAATDFFRFSLSSDVEFKRPLTVKLPLPFPPDDDYVISADDVAVCQTLTSQHGGQWTMIDGPLKLTRNSVAFDTRVLTKLVGASKLSCIR